jgi:putative DNA methylase
MINHYPKRLIEVDLPIKRISAHARREKSIRHGHISTLHIWWARRPLAACRAVICASLWPDPVDENCPQEFRDKSFKIILDFAKNVTTDNTLGQEHCSSDIWAKWNALVKQEKTLDSKKTNHLNVLRFALLDFIADFANWDNSTVKEYLETSRALTQAAHEALGGEKGTRPLVVDPFAGGGSIPLEALRVGADAFASDLNPIPVILNKVALELIPFHGIRLSSEVSKWGNWINKVTAKELSEFYPKNPDGSISAAFMWARTIKCEGPGCGFEVPLIRSLWLAKRQKNGIGVRLVANKKHKRFDFELIENATSNTLASGTVKRGAATCPYCGFTTSAENVKDQLKSRKGGTVDSRLIVVITNQENVSGRKYRIATNADILIANKAAKYLSEIESTFPEEIPSEVLPYLRSIFNINLLGVDQWRDLFSPRQLISIITLCRSLRKAYKEIMKDCKDSDLAKAIMTVLALAVDRQADYNSSLCSWHLTGEKINHTFGRQALGIIWDYTEVNPFSDASGNFNGAVEWTAKVCENLSDAQLLPGKAVQASATNHPLPNDSVACFITDPPYYDAVPYADLSDFFYIWLKRTIGSFYESLFTSELSDKKNEIVQLSERNPIYSYKTRNNFEKLMMQSLAEGRRVTVPHGLSVIVFAHSTTNAWEVMLQSIIDSGWIITASWPIDTEMGTRLRAMNSATLASSIHLVCRPRDGSAGLTSRPDGSVIENDIGDWRDVLNELPKRIHDWMPRLDQEGVTGADAIFACLGPALEIFSRYSRVERSNGEQVTLKEYLVEVWAAVAREALKMIFEGADASGFEEDARLTAMWLWTLKTEKDGNGKDKDATDDDSADDEEDGEGKKAKLTGGFSLEYDAARKISQGLGAHLEAMKNLVEAKGEVARLISVAERSKYLFGKDSSLEAAGKKKRAKVKAQIDMFEQLQLPDEEDLDAIKLEAENVTGARTTLDRVHQTMLLFAAGRSEAMKRFLVDDGVGRNAQFWRLAQSLSMLYPAGTEEKRWVDGVLARKKGLGL